MTLRVLHRDQPGPAGWRVPDGYGSQQAGSRHQAAGSRQQAAGSRQQAAGGTNQAALCRHE